MNIKKQREKIGISQRQLALKLGLQPQYLSNYESGKIQPNIETLIKIADYFNVSIDELLERETESINIAYLSEKQKELIKYIANANNTTINTIDAFVQGIRYAETERETLKQTIKNKLNG